MTLPAAALVMDRVIKRLAPERVVFSALGVREGWLYAQLPEAERYLDPLHRGRADLRRRRMPACRSSGRRWPVWTEHLFAGESAADKRLRVAACALSDIAWRDHEDSPRDRELQTASAASPSSASTMTSASSSRPPSTRAMPAAPTIRASCRPSICCRRAYAVARKSSAGRSSRLPPVRRRAGPPRRRAPPDRRRYRPSRSRPRGASTGQRSGFGSPAASGRGCRHQARADRRGAGMTASARVARSFDTDASWRFDRSFR